MEATIGGEKRNLGEGDIVQIGKGVSAKMTTGNDQSVRYAAVESLSFLEEKVDQMRARES